MPEKTVTELKAEIYDLSTHVSELEGNNAQLLNIIAVIAESLGVEPSDTGALDIEQILNAITSKKAE